MKELELRRLAVCGRCRRKLGEAGSPMFTVLKFRRHVINLKAINRQAGLEMLVGSPVVALAMGPDEDMAKPLSEEVDIALCSDCETEPIVVAALHEEADRRAVAEKGG